MLKPSVPFRAMTTTVHLVRHGQVENPAGVIYGRLPGFHLSERGRGQARAAADRLANAPVGALWSSPLERAQETAAEIATRHGLEIVTDDRLLESVNSFEGFKASIRGFAEGLARSPGHWWNLRNPLKPSWGETFAQIRERMLSAVRDAVRQADGKDVVIVSHQSPILVARLALTRRRVPPWLGFTPCETGSVTTLVLDGDRAVSASYFVPDE